MVQIKHIQDAVDAPSHDNFQQEPGDCDLSPLVEHPDSPIHQKTGHSKEGCAFQVGQDVDSFFHRKTLGSADDALSDHRTHCGTQRSAARDEQRICRQIGHCAQDDREDVSSVHPVRDKVLHPYHIGKTREGNGEGQSAQDIGTGREILAPEDGRKEPRDADDAQCDGKGDGHDGIHRQLHVPLALPEVAVREQLGHPWHHHGAKGRDDRAGAEDDALRRFVEAHLRIGAHGPQHQLVHHGVQADGHHRDKEDEHRLYMGQDPPAVEDRSADELPGVKPEEELVDKSASAHDKAVFQQVARFPYHQEHRCRGQYLNDHAARRGLFELLHAEQKPADVEHGIHNEDGLHRRDSLVFPDEEERISEINDEHQQRRQELDGIDAPEPDIQIACIPMHRDLAVAVILDAQHPK